MKIITIPDDNMPDDVVKRNLALIVAFGFNDGYRIVYRKSTGEIWDSRLYQKGSDQEKTLKDCLVKSNPNGNFENQG
jgi:hypothetical protein